MNLKEKIISKYKKNFFLIKVCPTQTPIHYFECSGLQCIPILAFDKYYIIYGSNCSIPIYSLNFTQFFKLSIFKPSHSLTVWKTMKKKSLL